MNTDLLAISNIFSGTTGIGPDPVKPTSTRASVQFSPLTPDNTPPTDTQGTETADKFPYFNPKNGPKNVKPSEFDPAPGEKAPQKDENGKNAAKQDLTQIPAEQPSIVQAWLTQYSPNIEQGKKGVARKVEPKAGYKLAQSLKNLKQEIAFAHTVQPTKIQISETVPTINQNQIGSKTALPVTSQKPPNEGEQPGGIQISNTKLPASRGLTNQQGDKGSALKALIDAQSETNTANGKPAVAGKSVLPGIRKVPASNAGSQPVQDNYSGLQSQSVRIGPVKFPSIADKAAGNKTTTSQQGPTLPEPSVDNKAAGKPSHHSTQPLAEEGIEQDKNSQGKPAQQKLHQAQLHISTGQIKERGSSASSKNSDSGFEQILSANNAATYIKEQSSPFPDTVTTDNIQSQTPTSDFSASITEQILESIHSTSSQQAGSQEITIRLNPPELGKVFIKFEEQENQITGLLEVSKAQTRYEVEQALPHIIQNLADCGIQVKRLEVILTDQGEQQPYRDEFLQDGTFQQNQDFSEGGNPDNHGTIGTNESIIGVNSSGYLDSFEPQMQITDNSINILI